ncbi:MAG: class I SAM-dependent methyltransferase [Chloroflexi bacterium]|nr:MAG: class I SAM-dependent methyltransferase [Chloroflexota bacterium]
MTTVPEVGTEDTASFAPPCRLCGAELRETVVDLGKSPLCESFLTADQLGRVEHFYPLHVRICGECLLVQLQAYVSASDIFSEYAYFSSFSDSWVEHARRYAEAVMERFSLGPESFVLELASNDGYLLQHFVERGIPVLGVDPAANVARAARERGVETMVEYFDAQLAERLVSEGRSANLVVGNNVLAQIPALNDFVRGIAIVLAPQGVATIEVPHVVRLIEEVQFDTIYHEHFSYFSLTTLTRLFAQQGLEVFDVEELPSHGGSLRVYAKRAGDSAHERSRRVDDVLEQERLGGYDRIDGYRGFSSRVVDVKWKLLELLIGLRRRGKSIAAYGAPGKGNTLLNYCGIRTDLVEYTVDRNPHKQGKFLPGTHIPIYAPERIERSRPDYILILPWNLQKEIAAQLAYTRSWGAKLIVPIPAPRVVGWAP